MNTSSKTIYQPETYYQFSPFAKNWVTTYGVMTHCENNQCYWILDVLASYVSQLARMKELDYFLIVSVEVNPDKSAVLTIKQEDHSDSDQEHRILVIQEVNYTDLKESLKWWAINESSGMYDPQNRTVLLLPEEY